MPDTFSDKPFQTAAHRLRGRAVTFSIQHWEPDPENPEGEGTEIDVVVMVDPMVDLVRVGAVFGDYTEALQGLNGAEVTTKERIRVLDEVTPPIRAGMREVLIPQHRHLWDRVAPGVDINMLAAMLRRITTALSGLDPTQPASFSDGSPPDGTSSTDGALHEESISDDFPSVAV